MEQFIATLLANPITLGLVIVLGFVILLLGAEGLVDGASSLAKRLGVSDLMIGLTIVAFGTSMPEFVVNMFSVANNATDLAITNILGSNIINTLVILGCSALVYPIAVQRNTIRFELPMNILAGALIFLFVFLTAATATERTLSRLEGMALLLVFTGFLFYSISTAKDDAQTARRATAALGISPSDLINDLNTFGFMFETLVARDIRIYADALKAKVYHFRDSNGSECDMVIHRRDGSYGLCEVKLGGPNSIEAAANSLKTVAANIDTTKMQTPSFLLVLTAVGPYAYRRKDGIYVVPISCLRA